MSLQVHKLSDTLYQFNESADFAGNGQLRPYVDAYLLIGTKHAALIDCLQNVTGLYDEIRKLTSLPIDVLITHGHGDHAGASTKEFAEAGCPIYMVSEDFAILSGRLDVKQEWFTDLKDGDSFDLGGYRLETIACGGHSPGSVVFLEREHQMLFSGDTIGSGHFWMQLPNCIPLSQFCTNLRRTERTSCLPRTPKPVPGTAYRTVCQRYPFYYKRNFRRQHCRRRSGNGTPNRSYGIQRSRPWADVKLLL